MFEEHWIIGDPTKGVDRADAELSTPDGLSRLRDCSRLAGLAPLDEGGPLENVSVNCPAGGAYALFERITVGPGFDCPMGVILCICNPLLSERQRAPSPEWRPRRGTFNAHI